MLKLKYIILSAVLVLFLTGTQSFALMATSGESAGASPSQTKILKVAGIVSKIQGNVLYLESGNQYSLNGVKVSYSRGKTASGSKKIADMFFINGTLKEVTIR